MAGICDFYGIPGHYLTGQKMIWHKLSVDKTLAVMESPGEGISPAEATARLAKHGSNELEEKEKKPA